MGQQVTQLHERYDDDDDDDDELFNRKYCRHGNGRLKMR